MCFNEEGLHIFFDLKLNDWLVFTDQSYVISDFFYSFACNLMSKLDLYSFDNMDVNFFFCFNEVGLYYLLIIDNWFPLITVLFTVLSDIFVEL